MMTESLNYAMNEAVKVLIVALMRVLIGVGEMKSARLDDKTHSKQPTHLRVEFVPDGFCAPIRTRQPGASTVRPTPCLIAPQEERIRVMRLGERLRSQICSRPEVVAGVTSDREDKDIQVYLSCDF